MRVLADWRQASGWRMLGLVLIPAALACRAYAGEAVEKAELTVTPLLCIVDHRQPTCDLTVRIEWRAQPSGSYCVTRDVAAPPLQCWVDDVAGAHADTRRTQSDVDYFLNQGRGEMPIRTVTVEVLRVDGKDRRRRRRTRHVWDIL